MSRPGYKTKSDTMLLRRLINNLKERGSEVAGELERKAHNFLTDVQMKRKPVEMMYESDEDSDWEDIPSPPVMPPSPKPPPIVLPVIEPPRPPTPPSPSPPVSPVRPSPPPTPEPVIPEPPPPEPEPEKPKEPREPLPNRQQIRTLTKDTPSNSADKPKLTPDCKLYWIQKHLEQELEEEEERVRKRKMSVISTGDNSSEEEEKRKREEEERNRLEEERRLREEEERKLREEAEKLRLFHEAKAKEEARRKEEERKRALEAQKRREEEERRLREQEEARRKAEEAARKKAEEDARRKAEEEARKRKEEEARKKAEEEAKRLKEEDERARLEKEMREMEIGETKKEEAVKKKSKVSVSGQRSKKPTMAREWRKLKEKQKHEKEEKEHLAVEKMDVDTTPEVSPLPPRAKYVPPVFKENECYSDRHNTFLTGNWPHNNKKGIPTPAELSEAGFFLVGPGDYCRCYQCGLEQMCWEPFESPWVRHAFLAPDCCYVERIKSNPDGTNNNGDLTLAPGENGNYRLKKQRSLFSFFKGK